ncbi:DNA helicase [Tanacetum coccineum]|uniref:DNA helicase n=1 Tax=Tanacetum coccineum TaxID=301880 RepID=A0ABQ5BTI1_9ASTR
MGGVGETGIVDIRGSRLGHVDQNSGVSASIDNQLGCLATAVVSDVETGTIDTQGLCPVCNVVSNMNDAFCVQELCENNCTKISDTSACANKKRSSSGILMYGNADDSGCFSSKRQHVPAVHESSIHSRSGPFICGNADGSGSSSSRSQHVSVGHDNHHWGTLTNDYVFVGDSPPQYAKSAPAPPNAGNYSNLHVVNEVAPSYLNHKRTRDAMSIPATLGAGSSSSSTRCPLSAGHCNVNTTPLNNNPVPTVGPSGAYIHDFGLRQDFGSSYLNRKRTSDAMATTASPDTSSSRPPTRRRSSIGRCNVNTVTSNNDTMPIVDFAGAYVHDSVLRQDRIGPPTDNVHIGKCEHSCEHCGARFWYEERIKDTRRRTRPAYHRCCMAGRVVIRTYQIYPEYIKLLLRDRHFMENKRAYNQMFSMTSLGARIDESVNIGRGPYVFKISGQLYHWLGSDSELRRDIVEGLIELLDNHNALYSVVDAREYELPTGDTLGAIVYEPGPDTDMDFDIIIEQRTGQPQRVNKLHPSYMALQFPLLFVYGEDGYSKDMKMVGLFQQYVVTAFCAVEQSRIDYIREHQNDIRNDYLSGGPRYMYAHYLDALAICRVHGNPSYFITFTCNVKWPEIAEYMDDFPEVTTADRADIVDRFQKRGLPHCHTLIWVYENSCVQNHEDIDNYICAELPSKEIDPEGHIVVAEFMIHGPCGPVYPTAVCMKGVPNCTKYFPKDYCQHTYIDAAGFVHYRRRDTGSTTTKQNVIVTSSLIIKQLLKTFYAHINVENYGWTMLIKYLFKYISKGTDRIAARVSRNSARTSSSTSQPEIMVDEIKNYLDSRYVGTHEACRRLFEFDIRHR